MADLASLLPSSPPPLPDDDNASHAGSSKIRHAQDAADERTEWDLDPFDAGCLWTQRVSTQAQKRAWRRGWQLSSSPSLDASDVQLDDSEEAGPSTAPLAADDGSAERRGPLSPVRGEQLANRLAQRQESNVIDLADSQDDDLQHVSSAARAWWDKGKTAPLLRDFDAEKRAWYAEQAGLCDQGISVHDGIARTSETTAQPSLPLRSPQSVFVMGARTVHSASTPSQGGPLAANETSTIAPTTPFGMARSTAQSTNHLTRSAPAGFVSSSFATPKRKTWNTTWGSVTSEDRTPAGISKRQAQATQRKTPARGRGRGRAGRSSAAGVSTPKTQRGRGRGRGRGMPSALR